MRPSMDRRGRACVALWNTGMRGRDGHACCGKMPWVAMQYCTVNVGMVFSCG